MVRSSGVEMTSPEFDKCHIVTAAWEGGWSDHADDPGGKTMFGVTEATWHAWLKKKGRKLIPVRTITRTQALELYFEEYWLVCGADKLATGVNLAVYDASVNSGVSRGRKWLLASIGGTDVQTVKKICAARLGFMQSLKIWKTFGKGWARRVADVEARGVAWALAGASVVTKKAVLQVEREKAASVAKKHHMAAGTSGAAAGGSGGALVTPEQTDQLAGYALTGVLVVALLVAAYFLSRSIINRQRAKAYAQVAEAV